jgi:hypothetical protein
MLSSFSLDALTDLMNQSISKRIVAILDCCHSGAAKLDRGRVNEEDSVSEKPKQKPLTEQSANSSLSKLVFN